MTEVGQQFPQFYITASNACPYLPERAERKIFTELAGPDATALSESLGKVGFRRSQSVAYRPACEDCQACISVRVRAQGFTLSKSMKRVMRRNTDIKAQVAPPTATDEQYALLSTYLKSRHHDGTMADLSQTEYKEMVESSPVATHLIEYRTVMEGKLIAAALTDTLNDGCSMVYSFFDTSEEARGLGNYIILDHIKRTAASGLAHVYMGYWIKESPKMNYKARFQPMERLGPEGWFPLAPDDE